MQMAILVNSESSLKKLNECLDTGWQIHSMCGMPSSCAPSGGTSYSSSKEHPPTCLVIIDDSFGKSK